MRKVSRIIWSILLFMLLGLASYIALMLFQDRATEVVDLDEIQSVQIEVDDSSIHIWGEVSLSGLNGIRYLDAIQQEEDLYIYLVKTPQLIKQKQFDQVILDQPPKYTLSDIEQVILVGGQDIIVTYPDDPKQIYIEVENREDEQLLWTRE